MSSKPKTIGEFLNELPEPYRSQAIENTKNMSGENRLCVDMSHDETIIGGLFSAFSFNRSPQGGEYWYNLCESLPK